MSPRSRQPETEHPLNGWSTLRPGWVGGWRNPPVGRVDAAELFPGLEALSALLLQGEEETAAVD